jgi:hypothetical protein
MMSRASLVRSLVGIVVGAVAVAAVIWFLLKHSTVDVMSTATAIVAVGLLALLVGVTASRASGVALFAGGVTLILNDALLAAKFATILGFGHLSLADALGLWPASALLVILISSLYFVATVPRRRWVVFLVVVLAVVVSWPASLSSEFFI